MGAAPTPPAVPGLTGLVQIGLGGFGAVYRALDEVHDRVVAVKVLQPLADEAATARLLDRERRAIGRLSGHPNIVVVYASGVTDDGHPYVVMDHLAGGSLADRLRREGPIPPLEAAAIAVKICGALEAAHRLDVIHRDVKPANILLTAWGEPKLADFGIARIVDATSTSSGSTSASLAHAAPEILDGRTAVPASDVYSLASTLHHLIAGRPPFVEAADEGMLQVLARIAMAPPPGLHGRDGVGDGLADLVLAGLAKRPEDRPASAETFGRALSQQITEAGGQPPQMVLGLDGTTARPDVPPAAVTRPRDVPSPVAATQSRLRRMPTQLLVAAGVLLVAGVVAAVALRTSPVDVVEPPAADGRIAFRMEAPDGTLALAIIPAAGGPPELVDVGSQVGRPALSPDGDAVAVSTLSGLAVVTFADGRVTIVHDDAVRDPAWSPDGRTIAFAAAVDGQQDLFVVPATGGAATALTSTPWDEGSPTFSPDGATLAFDANPEGSFGIYLLTLDDPADVEQVPTGLEGDDETPAFSPDGAHLAIVNASPANGRRLALIALADGDTRILSTGLPGVSGPTFSPDGRFVAFAADEGGDPDLYLHDLDTSATMSLISADGIQIDPSWSR